MGAFIRVEMDGVVHVATAGRRVPHCLGGRRDPGDRKAPLDQATPLSCLACLALPWAGEPDGEEPIRFEHAGLACRVSRGGSGAWCGYVSMPIASIAMPAGSFDLDVRVHGGVTYDRKEADTRTIGFHCAHAGDGAPDMRHDGFDEEYRTMDFAIAETRSLAEQVRGLLR